MEGAVLPDPGIAADDGAAVMPDPQTVAITAARSSFGKCNFMVV